MAPRDSAARRPAPPARGADDVTVRAAMPADLEIVLALRLALLREHARNPLYARLRADAAERARPVFAQQLASAYETTFLAERGGEVVGILRCVEAAGSPFLDPPRHAYISSVYVVPAARRTGVLQALMRTAEAWCGERGLDEMRLHSTPENATGAAAWEALGFEVVEVLRRRRL